MVDELCVNIGTYKHPQNRSENWDVECIFRKAKLVWLPNIDGEEI